MSEYDTPMLYSDALAGCINLVLGTPEGTKRSAAAMCKTWIQLREGTINLRSFPAMRNDTDQDNEDERPNAYSYDLAWCFAYSAQFKAASKKEAAAMCKAWLFRNEATINTRTLFKPHRRTRPYYDKW